jgi:hypothetical protein
MANGAAFSAPVWANTNPNLDIYNKPVGVTLYKGQRINIPVNFALPQDHRHLATLGFDNNQPRSMDCKIEIFDSANTSKHYIDCRAGIGLHTYATPVDYWQDGYRAIISLYNGDFSQSSQRFEGNFRFNFGESTRIDNDHLPTWWKKTYDLVGLDANTDYDGDGFSLIQEYYGNSKPNDADSYPAHPPVIDFDEVHSASTVMRVPFGRPVTHKVEITPTYNNKVKSLELIVETRDNARNQSVVAFIHDESNNRVYPSYLKWPGKLSVALDEPVEVEKLKIELTGRHYSSRVNASYNVKVNATFTE